MKSNKLLLLYSVLLFALMASALFLRADHSDAVALNGFRSVEVGVATVSQEPGSLGFGIPASCPSYEHTPGECAGSGGTSPGVVTTRVTTSCANSSPSVTLTWTAGGSGNSSYACIWDPAFQTFANSDCYGTNGGNQPGTAGSNTFSDIHGTPLQIGETYNYQINAANCPRGPGTSGCGWDNLIDSGSFAVGACPLSACNPSSPSPTADIKANGSDGPITIGFGESATLTWTSTNVDSCTVSPGNGSGTSGSESTGALVSSQTYSLNCRSTPQ